jgi:hypothetical protein
MRFYLQQNVVCLTYEHPLLLDRSRGWTPKNHGLATGGLRRAVPEKDEPVTMIEPDELYRFEGEGGLEVMCRSAIDQPTN